MLCASLAMQQICVAAVRYCQAQLGLEQLVQLHARVEHQQLRPARALGERLERQQHSGQGSVFI